MNNIDVNQNSDVHIKQLAAQRELYSSAKFFHALELFGSIVVPALSTIIAIFIPPITYYSAIYGISFYFLDTLLLEPEINKRRAKATKVQELFDSEVLDMAKSDFRTVSDITVEDILRSYDAHSKLKDNIERLKNWYPPEVGVLDISIARLVCQRLNYCWDSRLRKGYATFLKIINVLIAIVVFVAFATGRLDGSYLPLAFTSLLPFFRFSIKQFKENQESIEKLTGLNSHFESLWQKALNGSPSEEELAAAARRIQDEIYDNRMKNPLIPDFFFWLFRNRDESLMQRTAALLIHDYEESMQQITRKITKEDVQ